MVSHSLLTVILPLFASMPFAKAEQAPEYTFYSKHKEDCGLAPFQSKGAPSDGDLVWVLCGKDAVNREAPWRWNFRSDGTLRPQQAQDCSLALDMQSPDDMPHDYMSVKLACGGGAPTTSWQWDLHADGTITPRKDSNCRLAVWDWSWTANGGLLQIQCSGKPDEWSTWKTTPAITKEALINVVYPTLEDLPTVPLTAVDKFVFCNDNDEERSFSAVSKTCSVTTGNSWEFSFDESFKFESATEVDASEGIPAVEEAKGKVTTTWGISVQAGQKVSGNEQHQEQITITYPALTLQPHKSTTYVYSQFQGKLPSLPYTAILRVSFEDGTHVDNPVSGVFSGSDYTEIMQSWENEMDNVTSCTSLLTEAMLSCDGLNTHAALLV